MKRSLLLAYQWVTGLSDTGTGVLLCVAPEFTLRLMGLHAPPDAKAYVAYIGAFVFSVGLACLYGVMMVKYCRLDRLEVIWLLTAFTRTAVALYVFKSILDGTLEPGWVTVAAFDGACVVIHATGIRNGGLAKA